MPLLTASACIERAGRRTRAAFERWDAADPGRIEHCQGLLEDAISEVRTAIDVLSGQRPAINPGLESRVRYLREEVARMTHMVDACSAFHRELSLRLGLAAPAYSASGRAVDETSCSLDPVLAG